MRSLLVALLPLLLACSAARFGVSILDRGAASAGWHADDLVADGRVVHYLDTGAPLLPGADRPPVLLLHGFGGSGLTTWRAQLVAFAAERRVIVPDLLWFGDSTSTEPPTLDAQVAAAVALLDAAGVPRADVVGISYGGFVALQLVAAAPDRVGRLVVVDSPGPFFTAADQADMLARLGVASADELFLPASPEAVGALLDITSVTPRRIPRPLLADIQRSMFTANRAEQGALLADLVARRGQTALPTLAARHDPLVVWGDADAVFPVAIGHTLAAALRADLVIIPHAAHAPCAEAPAAFNAAVLRHLDRPTVSDGGSGAAP